jgi:protein-disulfide isomerase
MRHPDAMLAAQASLAAKAQGKFWPYYEKLVAAGNRIQRVELERIATELGLNSTQFKADLDGEKFRGQVLTDSLLTYEVGAHSYPNILANGVRINKAKDYASLRTLVATQLATAENLQGGGLKAENLYLARIVSGKSFPQLQPRIHTFNNAGSPTLGPEKAKIEVTVFEDFQCPFCARIGPTLKALNKRFPNDIRIVFKHLPLDIHADAQRASEAAMMAHASGKFWALHDLLFRNQQKLSEADIIGYAQSLDLDVKALQEALSKGSYKSLIGRDVNDAKRAGVSGTPSVFLNGRRYTGPQGYPPEGLEAVARAHLGL